MSAKVEGANIPENAFNQGPRLLNEIQRPYRLELAMARNGQAFILNGEVILAVDFIRRKPYLNPGDTFLVTREKTTPVKIGEGGSDRAWPNLDQVGEYGTVLVDVDPQKSFCVGDDYKVSLAPRSYQDRQEAIVRVVIDSTHLISWEAMPPVRDYAAALARLVKGDSFEDEEEVA
jgi:hypothetical protein